MSSRNGMFFHKDVSTAIKEGLWWEEHCIRRQAGYDFDKSNLPSDYKWLAKGTVLKIDSTTGKAVIVKTAKVYAAAEKAATTLKVVDTGLLQVGDKIAGSTISAISVSDSVATLTISALGAAVAANDIISDYDADADTLLGLAYETTNLYDNDNPQVTPTLMACEIEEDTLPLPINDSIKEGLNKNGIHLFKVQ